MHIIVVGGGNVGYYLVKDLKAAGHNVILMEKDRQRAAHLYEDLGDLVRQGDGCEARTMRALKADTCDLIVAATGEDEDNLIVCQLARECFGVKRTIARVNSPANEALFAQLGITTTVSSTRIIFNLIEQEIDTDYIVPVAALARGNLEVVSVELSAQSRVVGRPIGEVVMPPESHIVALLRGDKGILPSPKVILTAGDVVLALVRIDRESELKHVFDGL